ncbi:hypothetical protein HYC85_000197 [Camellia sinensis]|uniref:Uncharacterized protein n=1 Tax=Camellia sinensis TaxID=4442 RepID=A0A7J7I4E0_CAMSI|nr:hypothetical protein HYC85_000197 [Camellia sinensis]
MGGFKFGVERRQEGVVQHLQNFLLHLRPLNLLLYGQNPSVHHFHGVEAVTALAEVVDEDPLDIVALDLAYEAKVPETKPYFLPERQRSDGLPRLVR